MRRENGEERVRRKEFEREVGKGRRKMNKKE